MELMTAVERHMQRVSFVCSVRVAMPKEVNKTLGLGWGVGVGMPLLYMAGSQPITKTDWVNIPTRTYW